jgi:hypothetical protein
MKRISYHARTPRNGLSPECFLHSARLLFPLSPQRLVPGIFRDKKRNMCAAMFPICHLSERRNFLFLRDETPERKKRVYIGKILASDANFRLGGFRLAMRSNLIWT